MLNRGRVTEEVKRCLWDGIGVMSCISGVIVVFSILVDLLVLEVLCILTVHFMYEVGGCACRRKRVF